MATLGFGPKQLGLSPGSQLLSCASWAVVTMRAGTASALCKLAYFTTINTSTSTIKPTHVLVGGWVGMWGCARACVRACVCVCVCV